MPKPIRYVPLMLLLVAASAHAQTACRPQQEPGFMVAWNNQGIPDHSEIQSLKKGTLLVCDEAVADAGTPACRVRLQKEKEYTLPPHNAMRTPKEDLVALTCGGSGMRCCKVKVTPDSSPLKKDDTKPHPPSD